MQLISIAAASLNQTPLDWSGNLQRILDAIEEARAQGARLLCLPELAISGYGCEDAFFSPQVSETSLKQLTAIAKASKGIAIALGLPVSYQGALYDAAALVVDGRPIGIVAKRFLAREGIHYESRWFRPWIPGKRGEIQIDGVNVPFGDYFFELGGVRLGFEICEDAWVAQRPAVELVGCNVDILLNPSASHFAFNKFEIRKRFVLEGSRTCASAYVYANLLGNEAGRIIYDGGPLIASAGSLIAVGPRFSFQSSLVVSAIVDVDHLRMLRSRFAEPAEEFQNLPRYQGITSSFSLEVQEGSPTPASKQSGWEGSPRLKEEEFARAVALGLFDYLRKSRSSGFVISLSGGADSSATAVLVFLMLRMAVQEIGLAEVKRLLGHITGIETTDTEAELFSRLLTCVYQATDMSSATTRNSAEGLATALGATFAAVEIEALVETYRKFGAEIIDEPLSWDKHDLSLQNVQARARGPLVWLIANLKNALLLTTSNRSEAAVGYTTMDGDTCGGLSPIGGIDKAFLLKWLRIVETEGLSGITPIAVLHLVTSQEPTAELRPAEYQQTDEADLMPYEVLDAIERLAIRDRRSPLSVYRVLSDSQAQYEKQQLISWIERFFTLWSRNQWKRERYAPSFHLDDENLDPKTWCRFPILSGGYVEEIKELKQLA